MHPLFAVEPARASTSWLDGLHAKQRAFVDDPSKRKTGLAGRRGGKSEGLGYWFSKNPTPGETSLFLARTAGHAYSIIWPTLMRINTRHNLGIRFREDRMLAIFPNGHQVKCGGADTMRDVEKYRGPRYSRVGIDEAGSFPPALLSYLVNDILDPALMDLDGEMALTGTPGLVCTGFFHDVTTHQPGAQDWSVHTFTCLDNHYVKGDAYLKRKLSENRWDESNATYRREYLGEWVNDIEATIYPYVAARNACYDPPANPDFRVLSIDLGWHDATTFTVSVSCNGTADVWILRSYGKSSMTPSMIAQEIHRLRQAYGAFNSIVVDTGGLGKTICEDLSRTYGLGTTPADKRQKPVAIRSVADALRAGTLRVVPAGCEQLLGEWAVLPWNDERLDHHAQYADHCSDGCLYGYRAHPVWEKWDVDAPEPGTPDAINADAERRKAILSQRIELSRRNLAPSQRRALQSRIRY